MRKFHLFPAATVCAALIFSACLNMATVRKKPNPILRTQTDPITLKDKLEEVKDGEKGPATPVFGWYGGNKFMVQPPFDKMEAGKPPAGPAHKISEVDAAQTGFEEAPAEDLEEESDFDAEAEDKELEPLAPTADTREDTDKQDPAKWEKDWWDEI